MLLLRTALLLAVVLWGGAGAQKVSFSSVGLVTFTPTSETVLDALGATLEPDPASPDIRLKVQRQGSSGGVTLNVRGSEGLEGAPPLEVRYTVSSREGTSVTDWLPVTPAGFSFDLTNPVTDLEATYRVRLGGSAWAGDYNVGVVYHLQGKKGEDEVRHAVRISLPPVIALRLGTTVTEGTASLSFEYGEGDARSYLEAVEEGRPLPLTHSDVRSVEVMTNAPSGYTVNVEVVLRQGPTGGSLSERSLLLGARPAEGQRFSSAFPTHGFETLFATDLFRLAVDGGEWPGRYRFEIVYTAEINP